MVLAVAITPVLPEAEFTESATSLADAPFASVGLGTKPSAVAGDGQGLHRRSCWC